MNIKHLENTFKVAMEEHLDYIAVRIDMPSLPKPEIIVNPCANFQAKLDYYKQAYTEDLCLKTYADIRITGVAKGDFVDDLMAELDEAYC